MTKTLTYGGFVVSAILITLTFITAKNYTQLAIAMIIYPLLAYFALKVLSRNNSPQPQIMTTQVSQPVVTVQNMTPPLAAGQKVEVTDIDKRTFLKLIGTAGISFFLFSLLGRRAEGLLFGGKNAIDTSGILPSEPTSTSQSPTEGYKISEIDDGNIVSYYGFINHEGGWFIMREDTDTNSFRYARGSKDFKTNWQDRENLRYDYYHDLF